VHHSATDSNTERQRLPIVLLLHGGGSNSSGANVGNATQPVGGFDAFAEEKGFIAIYPDALGGHWNDGRETIQRKNDDVSFIIAAIDYVAKASSGDLNRVYVAGISNGGMMPNESPVMRHKKYLLSRWLPQQCHEL
jgi:polyhydroxybutyrate depolymerase